MILSDHDTLRCVGVGNDRRDLGDYHAVCTQTLLHISLSSRGVDRLLHTLYLFMSTLSLNIVPNRREHRSLYEISSAMDDLGACTIPIASRLYSKYRYRLLWNRPISRRSPPRHDFLHHVYNLTIDQVKDADRVQASKGRTGQKMETGVEGVAPSVSPK